MNQTHITVVYYEHGWRAGYEVGLAIGTPIIRSRWYPHRETVESISPNAISPFAWEAGGRQPFIFVPIGHWHTAAYYTGMFRLLSGYRRPGRIS